MGEEEEQSPSTGAGRSCAVGRTEVLTGGIWSWRRALWGRSRMGLQQVAGNGVWTAEAAAVCHRDTKQDTSLVREETLGSAK